MGAGSEKAARLRLVEGLRADDGEAESSRQPVGSHPEASADPRSKDSEIRFSKARGNELRQRHELLNQLPDESLVSLTNQGDAHAAEQLYRRHAGFAFNLAVRISGSTVDVEDVVHDAFLRAFGSVSGLRKPKAFRSWLGSIVVHAMRSRLRRVRLTRLLGLGRSTDPVDLECIAADEASPRARAELAQLYALLQTLPTDDRIAWVLRFVEGHDLKTAAELAGCSLATIKRRIRRAQSYVEAHFVDTSDREVAT